jgi:hypothetical protein
MARQYASSQSLKSIVGAAVIGLGLVILVGSVNGPTAQVIIGLLFTVARETGELLLRFGPTAWQALKAYAFDHEAFSPCALQMLVSFWELLHVMAGVA